MGFSCGCRLGLPWLSSGMKGTIFGVRLMGVVPLLYIVKTWEMDLPGLMVAWRRGGERERLKPWAWMGVKDSERKSNIIERTVLPLRAGSASLKPVQYR